MIVWIICFIIYIKHTTGAHFNGGIIRWEPVDPNTNSPTVVITITQRYSWVSSSVNCTTNVPITSASYPNANLTCVGDCSNDGGYSNNPIDILTDCETVSSSLNIMTSQRSVNITLSTGALFKIAYQGNDWRPLENTKGGSSNWSLTTLIDLRRRPDGSLNIPPESRIISPQIVILNQRKTIKIPFQDINKGDDVRCRWAEKTTSSVDECSSICFSNKLPPNTILTPQCELTFTGPVPNAWYAVAIQMEDFSDKTSTTPMSSIPIQFLIRVLSPKCPIEPVMAPLTECLEVQVGTPVRFNLTAINPCNRTVSVIRGITITTRISSLSNSQLQNSTENASLSYINVNWTPQSDQIGQQQICAIADTSESVQSAEYCTEFLVEKKSNFCRQTSTKTSSSITPTTENSTDSDELNIGLIIGLSLLGLLLALCCCCCCLFYFIFWPGYRRRSRNTVAVEENHHIYYYT